MELIRSWRVEGLFDHRARRGRGRARYRGTVTVSRGRKRNTVILHGRGQPLPTVPGPLLRMG